MKYYQPELTAKEWETASIPSFGVYRTKKNAEKAHPGKKIIEYNQGDIEDPTFMDDPATPEDQPQHTPGPWTFHIGTIKII